jgi:hypothetical protein
LIDQLSAGSFTDDLYARRAAGEGELLRGLMSQRDSSKTALNALMQDAQKRLQWAESLPQGTEGERAVRERMMYGATETIAAIQRDLDNFLNGINEQIANAQGRLQDAVLRLGTSASDGGTAVGWLQQRGMDSRDFSEHGSDAERRGLQGRDMREHMPPLNLAVTSNSGIASVFGASGAAVRSLKELNWNLSETPKALEKVGTSAVDAFGNLPPLMKKVEAGNERLLKQLDDFADRAADSITRGFSDGWAGARDGFRDLLLDMTREAMASKLRGVLHDLFNVKSKDGEQEQQSGGGFDLSSAIGGLFNRIFDNKPKATPNYNPNAKDTMPAAVRGAGQEAVSAVSAAGKATAASVEMTGDATARGLNGISKDLITGLGQVANMIAVGNQGMGFWKGLLFAGVTGAINGAIGAAFKPSGGGSFSGDGAGGSFGGDAGIGGYSSGQYATGGMISATSGGRLIQVAEGGYNELVLSTDPKYRNRTAALLSGFVAQTGISPHINAFAKGGFTNGDYALPSPSIGSLPAYSPAPINSERSARRSGDVRFEGDMIFDLRGVKNPQEFKRNLSKSQVAAQMREHLSEGMRNS